MKFAKKQYDYLKFSIELNAMNSFDIAIAHFKSLIFDDLSNAEMRDHVKICLCFLENSIELFLKSIIITSKPELIYHKNSKGIVESAKNDMINYNEKNLKNKLLQNSVKLKTISYSTAILEYEKLFSLNQREHSIIKNLGELRNAITHFGIHFVNLDEPICCFIETFDVIYNCLYSQLTPLDEIGEFFKEDGLIVNTPHGLKPLLDENGTYNNIVDFLDELEEIVQEYIWKLCLDNPDKKIRDFIELCSATINSTECKSFMQENSVSIRYVNDSNSFKICYNEKEDFIIEGFYSTFHNTTIFTDDGGYILFCVEHSKNKLYLYTDDFQQYPCGSERENYYKWLSDEEKGYCECKTMTQANLLNALKRTILYCLN